MTHSDDYPKSSPLSQSVTRDGKSVDIQIIEDGAGGWLLEVVDPHGNSTVWDASFPSDREALNEAFKAIDEEGIDSLIGLPSASRGASALEFALSNDEFDELDDFLATEALEEKSMDVSMLDGFLTAIALAPRVVLPSEWIPWVWDRMDAAIKPDFDDVAQADRIMSLIMKHYNAVIQASNTDPASFEPVFWRQPNWGAAEWCEGFLLAFQFNETAWSRLAIEQSTWLTPFMRLGTEDGRALTKSTREAERWMNEIDISLARIHRYWKEARASQSANLANDGLSRQGSGKVETSIRPYPKIGRNDPCPCGSGKKFKKCCGADGAPPSLH